MHSANQALLSGCSVGGLASILHCDEFRSFFSENTKAKCLADTGLFMDAIDVSGDCIMRNFFSGVVNIHGVGKNLPWSCTSRHDPVSCFFRQNLISNIRTPLFILNAAYDAWQLQASLVTPATDPCGLWHGCKLNHQSFSDSQTEFFQGFRSSMVNAVRSFSMYGQSGFFLSSCFAHCQSERQDTWLADNTPTINNNSLSYWRLVL